MEKSKFGVWKEEREKRKQGVFEAMMKIIERVDGEVVKLGKGRVVRFQELQVVRVIGEDEDEGDTVAGFRT